ncbi:MAG: PilZ domain-containing protein [Candidatus Omnitrophota bacterium]
MSFIKNISLGGISLATEKILPSGTNLTLKIKLPLERKPLILRGKVCWSRELSKNLAYETGIEFIDVGEKEKEIIDKLVRYYLEKHSSPQP